MAESKPDLTSDVHKLEVPAPPNPRAAIGFALLATAAFLLTVTLGGILQAPRSRAALVVMMGAGALLMTWRRRPEQFRIDAGSRIIVRTSRTLLGELRAPAYALADFEEIQVRGLWYLAWPVVGDGRPIDPNAAYFRIVLCAPRRPICLPVTDAQYAGLAGVHGHGIVPPGARRDHVFPPVDQRQLRPDPALLERASALASLTGIRLTGLVEVTDLSQLPAPSMRDVKMGCLAGLAGPALAFAAGLWTMGQLADLVGYGASGAVLAVIALSVYLRLTERPRR